MNFQQFTCWFFGFLLKIKLPSVFIIPMLQLCWTFFSSVGGGIFFKEFYSFTAQQAIMYCVGVSIAFLGVGLLATASGQEGQPSEHTLEMKRIRRMSKSFTAGGLGHSRGHSRISGPRFSAAARTASLVPGEVPSPSLGWTSLKSGANEDLMVGIDINAADAAEDSLGGLSSAHRLPLSPVRAGKLHAPSPWPTGSEASAAMRAGRSSRRESGWRSVLREASQVRTSDEERSSDDEDELWPSSSPLLDGLEGALGVGSITLTTPLSRQLRSGSESLCGSSVAENALLFVLPASPLLSPCINELKSDRQEVLASLSSPGHGEDDWMFPEQQGRRTVQEAHA